MDGNGRWARRRHLPRIAGHRAGVEAVRSTVETAARIGIPSLTLYAFSTENWQRRPRTDGRRRELPEAVQERMAWAREATAHNTGMRLTLALNYSARLELVDAFRSILQTASNNGGVEHLKLDEALVSRHLYTSNLPDLDFVIRTSGEMRLSNFLLWQVAYAEIYVTETLWPDFRGIHLLEAIAEFQRRERRYGGIAPPGASQHEQENGHPQRGRLSGSNGAH
jgi:undecaprenyl diphosphate synthase